MPYLYEESEKYYQICRDLHDNEYHPHCDD